MFKTLLVLSSIWVTNALAIPVDTLPDHIGVYFDTGATLTTYESTPNVPFNAYVVITNPTAAAVWGVELGYRFVAPPGFENSYVRLGNDLPPQSVDLGDNADPASGHYVVGMASPFPQSPAVVFVTWELVLLDDFPLDIHLGPAPGSLFEGGLPAYATGDSIIALDPSSGSIDLPVATVNGGVAAVPGIAPRRPVVLEQCRPNPFNPRTTIIYALAREGRVRLVVHDLSGHAVRVLVDHELVGPGTHETIWDGLDSAGGPAASGVYFYRIEALGVSETKRMTLVR
jgi:hypothetical protein